MISKKLKHIIEALSKHKDIDSVRVLNEVGTNCENDYIRELSSAALIKKNIKEALEIVIKCKGKGINDLSSDVVMSSINELLSLKDKTVVNSVLDETINSNAEKEIIETARSVKVLLSFSL